MTESETTEADLWERARRDDGDAFAVLFDRHRARVYHRALGLLADPHDAEDVAAAAFFELWRKRRTVRIVQGSVLPWLLVTTVNLARNTQRSSARYQKVLRTMPRSADAAPPDPQLIETRTRLASSLRQLTSVDAALFVLTAIEDLPIAEAAAAVGVKPSAARMRLHRVRTRLRTDLHDLNPTTRPAAEGNC